MTNFLSSTKCLLRYADDTTLTAERAQELKSLLVKVKGENENGGLKLSIKKKKTQKQKH